MTFLRNNQRKLKSATDVEAINLVLDKYVDFSDIHLHSESSESDMELMERLEGNSIIIRFNEPLVESKFKIFTVVRGRYIEFELEMLSPAGPDYADFSYKMRIAKCSIALDKREQERTIFKDKQPEVENITTIKVRERESDFRKSLSVKMIVEEYINRIQGVDFKKIHFRDGSELPIVVQYVIESGEPLLIPDTSDTSRFFAERETFFKNTESPGLREELNRWLQNNAGTVKSVMVEPVRYSPLVGEPFTVGYLVLMNRDRPIDDEIKRSLEGFAEELSERIRNGNLAETKGGGKIIDVSTGGVRIELSDMKLVEKLAAQNIVVCEMNFKDDNPLLISGSIVYVYNREDGTYYVGVDSRGSRFGPQIKNVLQIHIDHFLYRRKQ